MDWDEIVDNEAETILSNVWDLSLTLILKVQNSIWYTERMEVLLWIILLEFVMSIKFTDIEASRVPYMDYKMHVEYHVYVMSEDI